MTFKDARSVLDTISAGDEVEVIRARNRTIVSNLGNGKRPMSEEEAAQCNLLVNVDWGEGAVLFAQALRQYTNAFQRPQRYFRLSIPDAPPEKKMEWELLVGGEINRIMKDSLEYFYVIQQQNASIVSHGIGPEMWDDKESWMPRFIPIRDLRVPTNTEISFRNLEWFAVRHRYTEGELASKAWAKNSKNWNKEVVAKILDAYHDIKYEEGTSWANEPEKMAQLIKQNGGLYTSDAVPEIPLWHFFFKERKDGETSWKFRIVPDLQSGCKGTGTEFIYDSGDKSYASDLSEILHCQFGDLNTDAPFMYHSVRSLGYLLVEPCFYTNLARCRTLQHLFESFNTWFRVVDPTGKARATDIQLFDKAIIPEGVSIIPKEQRHQIDPGLIDMVMSQLRQLQSEASSSYTQDADTGTSREQTAYETSVKVAQVNAMMSGMLLTAFFQKKFAYKEICRRFCIRNSSDEDVRKFQKKMKRLGIPPLFLNVDLWDIEPEVPLGAGNPTMEQSQANQLMSIRPLLSPTAQQKVVHMAISAMTQNPSTANELMPLGDQQPVSDGQKWASSIFGSLMQGIQVVQNESVPPADQATTLLGMMAGVVHRIESTTNFATMAELVGLQNVAQYIGGLIQLISQDESQGGLAKELSRDLGQLTNVLKGFGQRLQEQQQQQGGEGAQEAQAKIQAMLMQAEAKAKIMEANAAQKIQHKEVAFEADQNRKNANVIQDQQRKNVTTGADIQRDKVKTKAEIANELAKLHPELTREQIKSEAVRIYNDK